MRQVCGTSARRYWLSLPRTHNANGSFEASNCRLSSGGVHRSGVDKLPLSAAWWLMGMAFGPADLAFTNGAPRWPFTGFCRIQPSHPTPLVAAYEDCLRALKLSDRSDRSLRSCKEDHRNRTDWNYGSRAGSVDWRFRKSEFPAADEWGPLLRSASVPAQCRDR